MHAHANKSARTVCARIVSHWMTAGDFPDRLLPADTDQRALVQEIVYGTVRFKRALEWILARLVPRDPDPQAAGYLLIGLYQLFKMDNIPPHAALNETVEAAKADLDPARVRFVNGVLRNALRRKTALEAGLAAAAPGIRLSHPDVLVERWDRHYGKDAAEALCEWNNRRPGVVIRLNAGEHPEAQALRGMLTPHPADPERYFVPSAGTPVSALPGYGAGIFTVQDPVTQMAVTLLDTAPGLRLFDACSAPGGKTFAAADLMRDQGLIVAADLHEDRLGRLRSNAERMRFACIRVLQSDARRPSAEVSALAPFDRILLDVPCSNTGVLARRPDARWRFSMERMEALVHTQGLMLDATAGLLGEGGILVYSTCSLEPEENMLQVRGWLERHPGFRMGRYRESLPPGSGMDGAFAVQLIRDAGHAWHGSQDA